MNEHGAAVYNLFHRTDFHPHQQSRTLLDYAPHDDCTDTPPPTAKTSRATGAQNREGAFGSRSRKARACRAPARRATGYRAGPRCEQRAEPQATGLGRAGLGPGAALSESRRGRRRACGRSTRSTRRSPQSRRAGACSRPRKCRSRTCAPSCRSSPRVRPGWARRTTSTPRSTCRRCTRPRRAHSRTCAGRVAGPGKRRGGGRGRAGRRRFGRAMLTCGRRPGCSSRRRPHRWCTA